MGQPISPPLILTFLVAAPTLWASASPTCPPTLPGVHTAIVSCPHAKGSLLPVLTSENGSDTRSSVLVVLPDDSTTTEQAFAQGMDLIQEVAHDFVLTVPVMEPMKDCSPKQWLNRTHENRQGLPAQWTALPGFDCLDGVVHWAEDAFPALRSISVLGLVEGGNKVHRWSLVSTEGASGKTGRGTELRMLVAAPPTFPYSWGVRPADSCLPRVTTPSHRCKDFVKSEEKAHCGETPHFSDSNDSDTDGPHSKPLRKELGNASLTLFSSKSVSFLFGLQDTDGCAGMPCEGPCAASWQGTSRLQRGLNYMGYLEESLTNYKANFELVDLAPDNRDILKTPAVLQWVLSSEATTPSSGPVMTSRRLADEERVEYWYESTARAVQEAGLHLASYTDKHYSIVECESLCDTEAACNSFTYNEKLGHCSLRSKCVAADEVLVPADDRRAHLKTFYRPCTRQGYVREDAAARNHWVVTERVIKEEGGVWRGGSAPFQRGTVGHCKAVCVKDPLCNSFSFGHGGCYLKAKCVTPHDDLVDEDAHNADFKTYYLPCEKRDETLLLYDATPTGVWPAASRGVNWASADFDMGQLDGPEAKQNPQSCEQQPCPERKPATHSSIVPMLAIACAALGPGLTVLLVCAGVSGSKKEQNKQQPRFSEGRNSMLQ